VQSAKKGSLESFLGLGIYVCGTSHSHTPMRARARARARACTYTCARARAVRARPRAHPPGTMAERLDQLERAVQGATNKFDKDGIALHRFKFRTLSYDWDIKVLTLKGIRNRMPATFYT